MVGCVYCGGLRDGSDWATEGILPTGYLRGCVYDDAFAIRVLSDGCYLAARHVISPHCMSSAWRGLRVSGGFWPDASVYPGDVFFCSFLMGSIHGVCCQTFLQERCALPGSMLFALIRCGSLPPEQRLSGLSLMRCCTCRHILSSALHKHSWARGCSSWPCLAGEAEIFAMAVLCRGAEVSLWSCPTVEPTMLVSR
jgi:hypothetical protein